MAKITIHLEPVITGQGLAQLQSALAERDEVHIIIEAADAHQAGKVMKLLRDYGFDYQPRGSHDGRRYHLVARRKS